MRFQNKVAVVTGGYSGIGLATAKRFARDGASVVIAGRREENALKAAAEIGNEGGRALGIGCDVSDQAQVHAAVQKTISHFGGLHIIVNNAGLMIFRGIQELTREDWLHVLEVDLLGAFYFTREAFLTMKEGGAIVNVSSIHAKETQPLVAAYAASKAALLSLTRSAALEGKPRKIRVNAILPGAVDTPMLWDNPNVKAGLEQIQRSDVGKPEEIAGVIAFLASDDASFIQGASIEVDGGRLSKL